ncbi:hypothetical protein AAG747_28280 [Rapidithrix thailandica]|uniref:Uncharacterized protein n=1 Tax=Rapidithrix thailandica TaxID=413964 RepID=A0AAW9S3W5_9BACT
MKTVFLVLLGLCVLESRAQFVVFDPANFATTLSTSISQKKILFKHIEQLEELRKTLQVSRKAKEELEKTFALQYQIREDLKKVYSIQHLRWADLKVFLEKAIGIRSDPGAYRVHVPGIQGMQRILEQQGSRPEDARDLYRMLVGYSTEASPPKNYEQVYRQQKSVVAHQFAFAEFSDKRSLQIALSYQKLARELERSAEELQAALKTKGRFSMTEAERLSLLKTCQDYLLESMDLKSRAADLLRDVATQALPVKKQVEDIFKTHVLHKGITQTPQHKFGVK